MQRLLLAFAALVSSLFAVGEEVTPRRPLAPEPLRFDARFENRLIVKFRDEWRVRLDDRAAVRSKQGGNLSAFHAAASELGLGLRPLIDMPEAQLSALELRAQARSGRAQPDLAGLYVVQTTNASIEALQQIGKRLQALSEVEYVEVEVLGVPPPADLPPATPDLVSFQTYRAANPGLDVDYAWSRSARGGGVRVSDCEYGWTYTHEDLSDISLHPEPGQTIHPNVYANGWDQHGTAVAGELVAVTNAYGCSGICPEVELYTYSEYTQQGGYRRTACIANAIANSAPGDIVLLEMQTTDAAGKYVPAEYSLSVWQVVKTGVDAGVIVVGAAGNGAVDLDLSAHSNYQARGDSGAILVGAGTANASHDRLSFSTYGSRVNVQGWGQSVFTLGYGWYAAYGGDTNQYYTAGFSGTSSASPFVAGAAAVLQSFRLLQDGSRLDPASMRALMIATGRPQGAGGHIGPFVDLRAAILEVETNLPPTVTLGLSGSPMAEAGGVATVTATLSALSGQAVTVTLTNSGTATLTTDYTRSATSIVIAAGSLSGSITLTAVQDPLDETNETVVVDISTVVNAAENGTQRVTASITDDDSAPSVTLGLSGSPMAEAGGVATVTATLSALSGQPVTVSLTNSGTATLTTDYTRSGSSIAIPAGSLSGSITLTAVQDSLDETNETVVVDISSVGNATESGVQQVSASIIDDDEPAFTVSLGLSGSPMAESGGVATVTATLSAPSAQTVTVILTNSGTATLAADYTWSGSNIVIAAGGLSGSITLTAVQDAFDETNETVVLDINTVINGMESGTQRVTAVIADDDAAPTVTLGQSGSLMAEAGGVIVVTATLSAVSGQAVTVLVTNSGTATLTADYTRSASSLVILPGSLGGSFTLTAVQDALNETSETVVVDISSVANGVESGSQQVVAVIADDDPAPTVTLGQSGSLMAEAGGFVVVTARLSAVSGQAVTILVTNSGMATLWTDYTRSSSNIVIGAGGLSGTITLTAFQDAFDETDETVVTDISSVLNATELGTQTVAATIIDDDDPAIAVTLGLTGSPMAESGGVATVTATLSAPATQAVTVVMSYSGTAASSSDYTRSPTNIVIAAGDLSGSITLTALSDALYETNETVVLDINTVINGMESGTQRVTAVIADDDAAPTVTLGLSGNSMAEAGGVVVVTARLSAVSGQAVTIGLTNSGTATLLADYTRSGSNIVIAAGFLSGTITLTALQDAFHESNETVNVDISSVVNGTENGTQQVTVVIADDDALVTLHNLDQMYDCTPRVVTATTAPTGLAVTVTYNGSPTPPINVGTYAVIGTVSNAVYQGWTNGTLVVLPPASDPIVDNGDGPARVQTVGAWSTSAYAPGYWRTNYLHDQNAGQGTKSVTFRPYIPTSGLYEVSVWYPTQAINAASVPVDIVSEDGISTVVVNQRLQGGQWNVLGTNVFAAGTNGYVTIRTTGATNGFVMADAVKFVRVGSAPPTVLVDNGDGPARVQLAGAWSMSAYAPGYWKTNYLHDQNAGKGSKSVTFRPDLPTSGLYAVSVWYPAQASNAGSVPVDIVSEDGTATVLVNQRLQGGQWVALGTNLFAVGTNGYVTIRTTGATNGFVMADAVKFVRVDGGPALGGEALAAAGEEMAAAGGTAAGGTEPAGGAVWSRPSVWTSGDWQPAHGGTNLVDGDTNTIWVGNATGSPWWVMMDLGQAKALAEVDVLFLGRAWTNLGVIGSLDAATWYDLGGATNWPIPARYLYLNLWDASGTSAPPAIREVIWDRP